MPDSKAHVVLDAIQFATDGNIEFLTTLISKNSGTLKIELLLRILLTFLPETIEPSKYIPLLQGLASGKLVEPQNVTITRPSKDITREEAKRRIRHLRLTPLHRPSVQAESIDPVEIFLLCRAYQIDEEIGSIDLARKSIEPFKNPEYKTLCRWAASTLVPLQKLDEHNLQHRWTLNAIHGLYGSSGLALLLAFPPTTPGHDFSETLRNVVGPWLSGQIAIQWTKASVQAWAESYRIVYDWLLDLASRDYESAVKTYTGWLGPSDVDYDGWKKAPDATEIEAADAAYRQLGLALIYLSPGARSRQQVDTLISITAERCEISLPENLDTVSYSTQRSTISDSFLSSISHIHLTSGESSDRSNPLTTPSNDTFQFAKSLSVSAVLLDTLGIENTLEILANLALFEPPTVQWSLCLKVIHGLPTTCGKNDKTWIDSREKLLWLHTWNTGVSPGHIRQGIFSQVLLEDLHAAIFETLVTNGRYTLAINLYSRASSALDTSRLKDSLISVILAAYDNASNGNKTRGGIKKALEIISTFQPHFPGFQRLAAIYALIQATHRLSFYSLTLQHGVPLLPVNIRTYPEPLMFIEKLLKQNPRSYTKLDDLLDIGRDLVQAGRIEIPSASGTILPEPEAISEVEQAITASAISASLAEDDFDTAYSYIVNRLSGMSSTESTSEHLWQAAYQAGRFTAQKESATSPSALRRLEQRMELLSQALLLAPSSSLQEVLTTWQKCEEDLNTALALESQEEDAWQAKGDRTLPGGFSHEEIAPVRTKARESTRRAMEEEAPMGLFDVARGAAAALSKSAFPLHASTARTSGESVRSNDDMPRVRKRDMVSNMVTGGLASGIGWVIGAQPVKQDE